MECKVDVLMKNALSLMEGSESIFRITTSEMCQPFPKPSRQKEFEHTVTNFILDQEERIKQLEEYMMEIGSEFMQLSLKVVEKLKVEIKKEGSRVRMIKKITSYPDDKNQEPYSIPKISEPTTKSTPLQTCNYVSSGLICVAYAQVILPNPPLEGKCSFGFKPGTMRKQIANSQQNLGITSAKHPKLN